MDQQQRSLADAQGRDQSWFAEGHPGATEPQDGRSIKAEPLKPADAAISLADRWEGSDGAQAALVSAVAKASMEFGVIGRDAPGQIGNRQFKYAPFVNLTEATRRQLAAQGVIVLQSCSRINDRWDRLKTQMCGHGARYIFELDFRRPEPKGDDQRDSAAVQAVREWGKMTTYLRRYLYQMLLTLDGDPDGDDGGKELPAPQSRQREAPQPQRQETARGTRPQQDPPKPAQRPQEAPKPAPTQTQRPASQPPPAQAPAPAPARPEPTNAELSNRLVGRDEPDGPVLELEPAPEGPPRIAEPVVDRDPDTFDVTKLTAQELEDAIKINGRAIRITRADVDALYHKVSNDPTMTMQRASRNVHELALVELMERRREMEASGA